MKALDVISGAAQWSVDCSPVIPWLQSLPAGIAQCVVTSPPYYGLRSYLTKDDPMKVHEIGSEKTPEEFIAKMVEVFGEVRRVMRDDGVLWLNLGDSYSDDSKWGGRTGGKHVVGLHKNVGLGRNRNTTGLKPGDLLNMPHRVAQALQADGWYWRQTIIWAKKSPMPESISGWRWVRCRVKVEKQTELNIKRNGRRNPNESTNPELAAKFTPCPGCPKCSPTDGWILRKGRWRHTTAHEYVFMLTKSERYFCDGEAVKEAATCGARGSKFTEGKTAINGGDRLGKGERVEGESRNPRSVLSLSSESFKGSHFATFPSSLVKPFIEAATSAGGCCAACGQCFAPMVESERVPTRPGLNNKIWKHSNGDAVGQRSEASPNLDPQRHIQSSKVLGYRPTCQCPPAEPRPCIVLEPFAGSGTTLQVATHLGRRAIGCELNADYMPLIEKRVPEVPRCLRAKSKSPKKRKPSTEILPLFA